MVEPVQLIIKNQLPNRAGGGGFPATDLKSGGGGGTFDGMEGRLSAVETHIEHIRADIAGMKVDGREHRKATDRDFRILFGALIAVALGLAGLIGKGFGWL